MAHPTPGIQGLNTLLAGAIRLPVLFVSAKAAVLVGEIALRGIKGTLKMVGWTGENEFYKTVTSYIPNIVKLTMKKEVEDQPAIPEKDIAVKDIAISALAYTALGIVGITFATIVCGPAPKIYNDVLTWIGPIRISNDKHPLVQILETAIRK